MSSSPLSLRPSANTTSVARAFGITPPPDDDLSTKIAIHDQCLLKIRADLDRESPPSPENSPSYQSWYDRFFEDVDEIKASIQPLEDLPDKLEALETKVDELIENDTTRKEQLDELGEEIDELNGKVDKLAGRVDELAGRVDKLAGRVDKLAEDVDQIRREQDNGEIRRRNGLVTRFNGIVTPLSNLVGHEEQQKRPLRWYWKLHDESKSKPATLPPTYITSQLLLTNIFVADELIKLHTHYRIQIDDWLPNNTSDDSEDDDDLGYPVPPPSTLAEAVRLYRERAVMVLFERIGLHYQSFEALAQRHKSLPQQGSIKRKNNTTQGDNTKRVHHDPDTTNSDVESTTQAFTSPTQSSVG